MEQNKTNEIKTEKQTPFLKRVSVLENKVASLEKKIEIVIKSLRK